VRTCKGAGSRGCYGKQECETRGGRGLQAIDLGNGANRYPRTANPDFQGDASEMPRCSPPQCYLARKDPFFA
jgi:hypothetical protein